MEGKLPPALADRLAGYSCEQNTVGESSTSVFKFQNDEKTLFLKVDKSIDKIARERDVLIWLEDKLPIPKMVEYLEAEQTAYLLLSAVPGNMCCEDVIDKKTIRALADGLLLLQSVDISNCPFDHSLEIELQEALHNVQNGLVDMDDWEDDSPFKSPLELLEWLCQNRPPRRAMLCSRRLLSSECINTLR